MKALVRIKQILGSPFLPDMKPIRASPIGAEWDLLIEIVRDEWRRDFMAIDPVDAQNPLTHPIVPFVLL